MDFVIALLTLFLGLSAVALLLSLIIRPIFISFRSGRAVMRLGLATKQLEQAAEALGKGDCNRALNLIGRAMIYDAFDSDDMLRAHREHLQSFLSHTLSVAEHLSVRIENLTQLEHFLLERGELLALRFKLRKSDLRLRQKRKLEGKETPLWRNDEFQKKMAEVHAELAKNRDHLQRELEKTFAQLLRGPTPETVTYH